MRARDRCRIYDCTRFPKAETVGQFLAVEGESIQEGLGDHECSGDELGFGIGVRLSVLPETNG